MEIAQRVQLLNDRFSVMQELLDILRVHVQVGKSCRRVSDRCERVHVHVQPGRGAGKGGREGRRGGMSYWTS
jgi:hypothetical protein